MAEFAIATAINSENLNPIMSELGNPLGTVYGNFTTDGESPAFVGGNPANFSLAGCTEICQPCYAAAGDAVYYTAVGYSNVWITLGRQAGQAVDNSLAVSLIQGYQWLRAGGVSLNVNRTGSSDASDFAQWHRWYIIGKRTVYPDGSALVTLYHVDINLKTNTGTANEITYGVDLSSYTPSESQYGDTSEPSDDNGNYDNTSSDITIPTNTVTVEGETVDTQTPVIGMTGLGMLTIWKVSQARIAQLGQELWDSSIISSFLKSFYAPVDSIITLNLVPSIADVPTNGTGTIHLGDYQTSVSGTPIVSNQFYEVDMGELSISPYWQSALDFNPYTSIQLYLPYVGMVTLSPDCVMGKTIGVKYSIDCVTGQLVAFVRVNGNILYTFIGSCAMSIPITGANYGEAYKAIIQGSVGLATGVAGAAATGGAAGVVMGANVASGAVSNAVSGSKVQYTNGSPTSMTAGYLAPQFCYVVITRPNQSLADGYKSFVGYPSNITATLGSLSGFTSIESIHLEGINATSEELEEIESLLKSGVILESDGTTPTATGMNVQLYLNTSETNVIGKTLSAVGNTRACKLKESTSIIHPTIIVNDTIANLSGGNYMYIPAFNRFYYVTDMVQNQGMTEIQLRCDVLESHKAGIRACSAVIARQENSFNRKLDDPLFRVYQNYHVITQRFSGSGFGQAGYILVTAGGTT